MEGKGYHRFLARIEGDLAFVEDGEFYHLKRVLRLKVGDLVRVFNGKVEYVARVEGFEKNRAVVSLEEELEPLIPPIELSVAVSPPKGSRFDDLVEKLVEIGVSNIYPVICERTVRIPKKVERWQRIIISAVKQCERTDIPRIYEPMSLEEFLKKDDFDVKIAGIISGNLSIYDAPIGRKTVILIGPEGDFTHEEKRMMEETGFLGVSMGKIILRVETAALVASSVVIQKAWKL